MTQSFSDLSFSEALVFIRSGNKLARQGWNGKGIFVYFVPGSTFSVNRPPLLGIFEEGHRIDYKPHIDMKAADGSCSVWTASQTDILTNDWYIVE